ncbi:MAG: ribosomal RNA small subunit methyltransferase A [Candidatus Dadabacteria bacterium]|nr:ribosomal RNA small subunit methyltransferase A [Candidatus Dadabacteria bacterium]
MKIKEYKNFYASIKSHPKKSLGQNYLVDKNVLLKIEEIADLKSSDLVIEVGTGFGFLTSFLAGRVENVITIEKDKTVYDLVEQKFQELQNVKFICKDALDINFGDIVGDDKFKFISNLPYSVASKIIFGLLEHSNSFTSLVVMLQKEVGQRICSNPNSKQYGAFSVIIQSYFDVKIAHTVSPNSFWPKPDVDSVIIKMVPRKEKIVSDRDRSVFNEVVKKAFQTRRKKMINNLKQLYNLETLKATFKERGIDENARAEMLSVLDFVNLTRALMENS